MEPFGHGGCFAAKRKSPVLGFFIPLPTTHRRNQMLRQMAMAAACVFILAGCAKGDSVAKNDSSQGVSAVNPQVHFETTQGDFTVELFSDVPITTKNFVDLVSSGFYNGLTFHRYVPGFVIQGGDPTGTGTGGSGKTIPLEITGHQHDAGALGMARSQDPNSASCQFYICLDAAHNLDGGYTVFGRVTKGMENVLKLRKGDKMTKVTMVEAAASK
jgi:cyclophilin family peptidyl-prolyl cis-trans isomerase